MKILLKKSILKSKNKINKQKVKNKKEKNKIILKFILKLNISFEAIEVIYINKINIPPKKIKKRE